MPLPVIHAFAGYQIYKLSLNKDESKSWKMALLFMTLANLADLDMLPGMLFGNPDMFHRSVTHSLGAALICALGIGFLAKKIKNLSFLKTFLVSLNVYFSHVFLDWITGSVRFMLWPFKVSVLPITFRSAFAHPHHTLADCAGLGEFCRMLVSPTVSLRLCAEGLLVFSIIKTYKLFSKPRTMQPGASDSPTLVAGLAIFLFVITALMATRAAG